MAHMTVSSSTFQAAWPASLDPDRNPKSPLYSLFQSYLWQPVEGAAHKLIASLVCPAYAASRGAQRKDLLTDLDSSRQPLREKGGEEISLITPDGLVLNAMHFVGTQKKAILYVGGNKFFYEEDSAKILAVKKEMGDDVHLVVFNPRGVGKSEGYPSPQGLSLDVYTVFQYLVLEKRMDPNDIILYGRSLGGGYGADGAKIIQEQYPDKQIHMVHERSFAHLHGTARHLAPEVFPFHPWIVARISDVCVGFFSTFGWNFDSLAALEHLKGKKCIVYHKRDGTVPFVHSLYNVLKSQWKMGQYKMGPVVCVKLRDHGPDQPRGDLRSFHNRPFNDTERRLVAEQIRRMLALPAPPFVASKEIKVLTNQQANSIAS